MRIISQNRTPAQTILWLLQHVKSTVITLNNFYYQHVLTPRNNKRRIIRVAGTVFINCQFTSGIWIVVYEAVYIVLDDQPRLRTVIIKSIQMTSLVLRFQHRSRPCDQNRLQQMFKCLELIRASVTTQCHIPGQQFRAYIASHRKKQYRFRDIQYLLW